MTADRIQSYAHQFPSILNAFYEEEDYNQKENTYDELETMKQFEDRGSSYLYKSIMVKAASF